MSAVYIRMTAYKPQRAVSAKLNVVSFDVENVKGNPDAYAGLPQMIVALRALADSCELVLGSEAKVTGEAKVLR